jgi:hypothetical protein
MPFAKAAEMLEALCGVQVSEATARREAEGYGANYVTVQEEEVARIAREMPLPPQGPAKQLLSVDGAMIPLLQGEWAEVRTLVIGEIEAPRQEKGAWVVHARDLSYFSRLADAESFQRLALPEIQRRGVETALRVIAPLDGAEWEQKFLDYHRPDAVRILDFAHAAEYIAKSGAAVWGRGTPTTQQWLSRQLTNLKERGPAIVLPELRMLSAEHADLSELAGYLAYLEKREAQMQYPFYLAQGWPIGSGAVESGNKLVVEARLKGAGMHWAREHVNPLLALRNVVCNDRWAEAWPQICASRQRQRAQIRQARYEQRHKPALPPLPQNILEASPTLAPKAAVPPASTTPAVDASAPATQPRQPWRPPPDHPWRRFRFGQALFQHAPSGPDAKK